MADKTHWLYNDKYDQDIKELAAQGYRAWKIYVELTRKYGKQVLSPRTIRQRFKDLKGLKYEND